MTSASVAIGRASLSLSELTISGDGSGTYSLTAGGLARPAISLRTTFADASPHVEGQLLTQVVKDIGALPLEVLVQAASESALDNALTALDNALFQFRYTTTVTLGGVAREWASLPTALDIVSGSLTHAHWANFFEVVSFSIPVQPTPVVI